MPLACLAPRALSTSDARRRPRPFAPSASASASAIALLSLAVLMAHPPPSAQSSTRAAQHSRRGGVSADAATTPYSNSGLAFINPWLSACDFVAPLSAPDLRGVCNASRMASWPAGGGSSSSSPAAPPPPPPSPASAVAADDTAATAAATACRRACAAACAPRAHPPPRRPKASPRTHWDIAATNSGGSDHHNNNNNNNNKVNNNSTSTSATTNTTSTQCLCFLDEAVAARACEAAAGAARLRAVAGLRLRQCCAWGVLEALRDEARMDVASGDAAVCRRALLALLRVDALAAAAACKSDDLLERYDCEQRYSVRFGCADCRAAYRAWTCSALLPRFLGWGTRVRPCRRVCQRVEQRCPFFLPSDRYPNVPTQYAGEPTFFCLDPNIPEEGEQLRRSTYGDGGCCYWLPDAGECGAGSRLCLSDQCGATEREAVAALAQGAADPPALLEARAAPTPDSSTAASPSPPPSGRPSPPTSPPPPRCPAPGWPPPPGPGGGGGDRGARRGASGVGRLAYSACPPASAAATRPRSAAAAPSPPPPRAPPPSLLLSIFLFLLLLGDTTCCWDCRLSAALLAACALAAVRGS